MIHPVMAKTGHNFERDAIMIWVDSNGTCPITRKPLEMSDLVTNHALRIKIQLWCKNHGVEMETKIDMDDDDSCKPEESSVLSIHLLASEEYSSQETENSKGDIENTNSVTTLEQAAWLSIMTNKD
jgi:hypothetical protein